MLRSRALSHGCVTQGLPALVFMVSVLRCVIGLSSQASPDQSPATQSTASQTPESLAEMQAAGVRMAFDVASVKANISDAPASSRFPLGSGDGYAPGAFFSSTNQPLIVYLRFAYKMGQSELLGLAPWVYSDRFDIEARAQASPTKDQMRLMMQALLADRFKLITHTVKQTKPVLNLVLAKAGKTGPQLQAHSENESCSTASILQPAGSAPPAAPSSWSARAGLQLPPIACGSIGPVPASAPGRARLVGRRVTTGRLAGFLMNPFTGVERPVLDRTGLTGAVDFSVEWSLPPDSAQTPGSQSEDTGPTFLQALQDQLGLKLKSAKGPVDVLVIDHVEHPTEN
jgi:uncharacterized protein (TIGR03435 family)